MKKYEAKKIVFLHIRINEETNLLLNEICDKVGFDKSNLSRLLLNRSLRKLKEDALRYGWDNLEFTVKSD